MEAKVGSVAVLVGSVENGTFEGFKARFEGERVAEYKEGRDDKITCTLYLCEMQQGRGYYRVHEADLTDSRSPKYELHPFENVGGRYPAYDNYYKAAQVLERWPLFAEALDILYERDI